MACFESDLQCQVADYLRLQYPDVMFHSDFGSGVKLTPGQAVKQKRQNGGRRAWPDMVIAEPRRAWHPWDPTSIWIKYASPYVIDDWIAEGKMSLPFSGLYLELKKDGESIYPGPRTKNCWLSKDGKEYKNEHVMEQADCLHDLCMRGYCAEFAIGFDEAKKIIDEYLGGR